jgi:hypothetical protein
MRGVVMINVWQHYDNIFCPVLMMNKDMANNDGDRINRREHNEHTNQAGGEQSIHTVW